MSAVVAIMADPQTGGTMAVRFSTIDDLYKWEDSHPDAFVTQAVILSPISQANAAHQKRE